MTSNNPKTVLLESPGQNHDPIPLDCSITESRFVTERAPRSLRLTCYGSSSAKTPEAYLKEARSLGYILAKRGHVCVNGAGSFGCMAAMNDGALAGNGHIIGVIHEMFLVDNGYGDKQVDRDGGAHRAFDTQNSSSSMNNKEEGPIREILVASGNDLQQRKKLLVDKSEGLIVLPGGPGTWDELWEMACARHLGLIDLPIVCVNVNDYYEPFKQILDRAYEDELIKLQPHEIVHFAPSAEEAVKWIEAERARTLGGPKTKKHLLRRDASALKKSSFMSPDIGVFRRSVSRIVEETGIWAGINELPLWAKLGLTFGLGTLFGVGISTVKRR